MEIRDGKVEKILFVESLNKYYYPYQNWFLPLKKRCKTLLNFDFKWNYLFYGKETMNKMFLDLVEKEQPDLIIFLFNSDEFYMETLFKIKEISKKSKTFLYFGDDDIGFENFSRYMIRIMDYGLVGQWKFLKKYREEGANNVFFCIGIDSSFFRKLNTEKIYDVTFIGAPGTESSGRYETIKFLKDNGVNIRLFGWGWNRFPEFKDIYFGALDSENIVKVINQSKINLCLTKNNFGAPHIKAKFFECSSCGSFTLTEYSKSFLDLFKENREIVMFKDKEELLNKIKYYLKHEKERETIARAAQKRTINNYSLDEDFRKIFIELKKKKNPKYHQELPKVEKKVIELKIGDFKKEPEKLKEEIQNFDYVYFSKGQSNDLKYREYFQALSLEKSKKPISCCSYYIHNKFLGDYLLFLGEFAFRKLSKEDFIQLLNINQLMITKEYLFENFKKLKNIMLNNEQIDFIQEHNTVFISLPLIRINKISLKKYNDMKIAYGFIFLSQLFSLKNQGKIFFKNSRRFYF